ncbi:MarR family winged helix-turn-helix transcriptional regulator [Bacillus sp. V2I10]|uniref:MarR family winged helix-turn-helix transcriptional regulator n=1 Tax=Bacillus sp. V2I10 TaxID=3042276 RepID=UPI00278958C3|nr:MarR family transcriptional regulator [Bacillus sp. V2I10]MDQ0860987.1 DNA-binding MarR family transcriptional regulator [Bacillus sp. V2I10]
MEQLLDLLLKNGIKPLSYLPKAAELEKKIPRTDLSALVLLLLREQLTMSELASDLGAPLSTITSMAKRLEKKGWIERKSSPNDQRVIFVSLTKEGKELAKQANELIEEVLRRIQATLTEQELEQFLYLVIKVVKSLQSSEEGTSSAKEKKPLIRKISIDE